MEKIVMIFSILSLCLYAEQISDQGQVLDNTCVFCHQTQQIPSSLIYKRYLMKYSSPERIKEAIFLYLKNPRKENSIMPPQFFLKFPMKEALELDDRALKKTIKEYVDQFDVKKRLVLPQ